MLGDMLMIETSSTSPLFMALVIRVEEAEIIQVRISYAVYRLSYFVYFKTVYMCNFYVFESYSFHPIVS